MSTLHRYGELLSILAERARDRLADEHVDRHRLCESVLADLDALAEQMRAASAARDDANTTRQACS